MTRERRQFHTACRLCYEVEREAIFVFNICSAWARRQSVLWERLALDPELPVSSWTEMPHGNRFHRVTAPQGLLRLSYDCSVRLAPPRAHRRARLTLDRLPARALAYIRPSRYCESDKLLPVAQQLFGDHDSGPSAAVAICDWLANNMTYRPGSSDSSTSARDTFESRSGVCRDFAHLAIAFCRAINLPARFVSGYAAGLEPPDFHAMFEVYWSGSWHLFDPTGLADPRCFIRIGTGYDAAEVPFASIFGDARLQRMEVTAKEAFDWQRLAVSNKV